MKRFVRFLVPEKIPTLNAPELKIKELMLKPHLVILTQICTQFK
jgi:hypothetical protein